MIFQYTRFIRTPLLVEKKKIIVPECVACKLVRVDVDYCKRYCDKS